MQGMRRKAAGVRPLRGGGGIPPPHQRSKHPPPYAPHPRLSKFHLHARIPLPESWTYSAPRQSRGRTSPCPILTTGTPAHVAQVGVSQQSLVAREHLQRFTNRGRRTLSPSHVAKGCNVRCIRVFPPRVFASKLWLPIPPRSPRLRRGLAAQDLDLNALPSRQQISAVFQSPILALIFAPFRGTRPIIRPRVETPQIRALRGS